MEQILAILQELRPEHDFEHSLDFVEDGLLDSFDVVTLSSVFEERFGASIDGLDILPENFNSIKSMADLIKKSGGNI
ncbi:acyl carrier protein [Helicobacter labetoulli]|uniref:acyl carrier protein n=1 Tax=Helicobacter labetoulli TaxID=2315333 RepID=UPI000EF71C5B|nr:acyl carrier protein [Helicobacter labetoulli]